MPGEKYFLRLTGVFLLGFVALVIAGLAFLFLLPILLPLAPVLMPGVIATIFLAIIFIVIWIVVYMCMVIGVALYYAFTTSTEWVKEDKDYSISKTKESGRRKKGKSKK